MGLGFQIASELAVPSWEQIEFGVGRVDAGLYGEHIGIRDSFGMGHLVQRGG